MIRELWARVEATLGSPVRTRTMVGGGSINEARTLRLEDGRRAFLKFKLRAPEGMFADEAHGLRWLAEGVAAGRAAEGVGLVIPEVLAVDRSGEFLLLEDLSPDLGEDSSEVVLSQVEHDEQLGWGLAALHRSAPAGAGPGLERDNYLATLRQTNAAAGSWPEFYATRRLEPMFRVVVDAGLASEALRARFDAVLARLPELCGPSEPLARLHGDLWAGNAMTDALGRPALVDPAVYVGHREVDLAMMQLFGGFSPRVFDAYAEAWPLAPGAEARVNLYQLYPILVHVALLGASYLGQLEAALARLG